MKIKSLKEKPLLFEVDCPECYYRFDYEIDSYLYKEVRDLEANYQKAIDALILVTESVEWDEGKIILEKLTGKSWKELSNG